MTELDRVLESAVAIVVLGLLVAVTLISLLL